MAIEICEDCGKVFDGGPAAHFCKACIRKRLSDTAKRRNLNKIGNEAYSAQQAAKKKEESHV